MTDLTFVADMSHGNPVDFTRLFAASWNGIQCRGIIHKVSQGAGYADPKYALRRPQAAAAGFKCWGGYAFNTGENVAAQVKEFLTHAQPDARMLCALDYEDNRASPMTLAQAIEFLDRGDQAIGRRFAIYSGNRIKEDIVRATDAQREFLAAHALWGCQYGPKFVDVDANRRPLPWAEPFLWQDTGDGIGPQPHTLDGLEQGADLSIFKGTAEQLEALWPGAALVAQPAVVA